VFAARTIETVFIIVVIVLLFLLNLKNVIDKKCGWQKKIKSQKFHVEDIVADLNHGYVRVFYSMVKSGSGLLRNSWVGGVYGVRVCACASGGGGPVALNGIIIMVYFIIIVVVPRRRQLYTSKRVV